MAKLILKQSNMNWIRIITILLFIISGVFLHSQNINNKYILGKWILIGQKLQVNFPVLYFNSDSTAIFCNFEKSAFGEFKIFKSTSFPLLAGISLIV